VATFLADTSALARIGLASVGARLDPLVLAGRVATCAVVDLELGFSVRHGAAHAALMAARSGMPEAPITPAVCDRALAVQGLLAERGQHRAVPIPDLLVAAAAEAAGLVVLHYDADYELVAGVTGQVVEWVVPRGSVD
jgi:predicted nucleic acid-binding protein